MLSREPGCFSYALPESTEVEGFSSLSMHRVSRSIAPRCSKLCRDGCELPVFEYQGWPYEWPYSHLMMCSVWWFPLFRGTEQDISISNFPCKMGVHYLFRGVEMPHEDGSCFPWIFVDWYYSLPALLTKKHGPEKSPKQMVVSVICMTGCQNHQVVTDCFGCHILWLLARNNSTCRQRRCGRKRCWIDYPYPETDEHLNICPWWCMVPCNRYCIV